MYLFNGVFCFQLTMIVTCVQSGCCKPPSVCGFQYVNPVTWVNPMNPVSDPDCAIWNNEPNQLCYNCDSCKAGLLGNVRKEWKKANVIVIIAVVVLIWVYLIACCAYKNAQTEDLFSRYKQGWTQIDSQIPNTQRENMILGVFGSWLMRRLTKSEPRSHLVVFGSCFRPASLLLMCILYYFLIQIKWQKIQDQLQLYSFFLVIFDIRCAVYMKIMHIVSFLTFQSLHLFNRKCCTMKRINFIHRSPVCMHMRAHPSFRVFEMHLVICDEMPT